MPLSHNICTFASCCTCFIVTLILCILLSRRRGKHNHCHGANSGLKNIISPKRTIQNSKKQQLSNSNLERNAVLEDMVSESYFWAMSASQEKSDLDVLIKVCYSIGILSSVKEVCPLETLGKHLLPQSLGNAKTLFNRLVEQRDIISKRISDT